ncbi:MAG: LamG domain-containing protein [Defluviitaleaceae bacterium]|nr:LamG domain-containing protein [Defluviitaleaceae bacterium]MCL2238934.1 LamG domain-containing protein [Defluviitaleaceae bacterium]
MKNSNKTWAKRACALLLAFALALPMVYISTPVEAAAPSPAGAAHVFRFDGSLDGTTPVTYAYGVAYTLEAYGGGTGYGPTFVPDRHGNPNGAVQLQRASGHDGVGLSLGYDLIQSANYTIAMWVRPDYPLYNTYGSLFFAAVAGTPNWISMMPQVAVGGQGTLGLWSGAGGGRWSDNWSDHALTPGEWQHIALVVENGVAQFYVNGTAVAMRVTNFPYNLRDMFSPDSYYDGPREFILGRNYFNDPPFAGAIDDVYIYNRALNPSEVSDLAGVGLRGAQVWTFNNTLHGAVPVTYAYGVAYTLEAYGGGTGYGPVFAPDRFGNPNSALHLQRASGHDGVGLSLGEGIITSASYTIAMWVNPDYPLYNTYGSLFFAAVAGTPNWISMMPQVAVGGQGTLGLWSGAGGGRWSDNWSDHALTPGEWQHIALVVENGVAQFYVNGTAVAMRVTNYPYNLRDMFSPDSAYEGSREFILGRNYFNDPPFAGKIDDLHIFNRALNPAEMAALYGQIDFSTAYIWDFDNDFGGASMIVHGGYGAMTPYGGGSGYAPYFVPDRHGNPTGAVRLQGAHPYYGVALYLGEDFIRSAEYTVAMWVNPHYPLYAPFSSLFFGAVAGDNWMSFKPATGLGGRGTVGVWSGSGGGRWSDNFSDVRLVPGEWQHLAFVISNGHLSVYHNGLPASMLVYHYPYALRDLFGPDSPYEGPGHFILGRNYFGDPIFGADIDDLMIFNHVLSFDNIQALAGIFETEEADLEPLIEVLVSLDILEQLGTLGFATLAPNWAEARDEVLAFLEEDNLANWQVDRQIADLERNWLPIAGFISDIVSLQTQLRNVGGHEALLAEVSADASWIGFAVQLRGLVVRMEAALAEGPPAPPPVVEAPPPVEAPPTDTGDDGNNLVLIIVIVAVAVVAVAVVVIIVMKKKKK